MTSDANVSAATADYWDVSSTSSQGAGQLVVFSLGSEEYSLPISVVQEIVRYVEPTPVAAQDAWMRGVISLRGKIVPVCDLALRLGLDGEDRTASKIVIVETGAGTAGIIVDDVEEVLTVEEGLIEAVPTATDDCIEAIAKVAERLIIVLRSDPLFARGELSECRAAA